MVSESTDERYGRDVRVLYTCTEERAYDIGDLRGEEVLVVGVFLIGSYDFGLGCCGKAESRSRAIVGGRGRSSSVGARCDRRW